MKKIKGGMIVVLEGSEGVGKSTICKKLVDHFKNENYDCEYLREPGGDDLAEEIRHLALYNEMDSDTELFLMSAARNINIKKNILPMLKEGKLIIMDRFTTSTIIYQGYIGCCNNKLLSNINYELTRPFKDKIYEIILACDPEVSHNRIMGDDSHEKNKNDLKSIDDLKKLHSYYNKYFVDNTCNNRYGNYPLALDMGYIDTTKSEIDDTTDSVLNLINNKLSHKSIYEED